MQYGCTSIASAIAPVRSTTSQAASFVPEQVATVADRQPSPPNRSMRAGSPGRHCLEGTQSKTHAAEIGETLRGHDA